MRVLGANLVLFVAVYAVCAQKIVEISGYVVDEKGFPVPDAIISWRYEPERKVLGGSSYASLQATKDGYFGFTVNWRRNSKIRVYFETPLQEDCGYHVDITGHRLKTDTEFPSILIPKYKPDVNLGKVVDIVRYGTVEIRFNDNQIPLIKDVKDRLVYLVIRNSKGQIISKSTVNPDYDEKLNALRLCLPVGEWRLNLTHATQESIGLSRNFVTIEPDKTVIIQVIWG